MIFAHPDDEVLWASSILKFSQQCIICFSESPGHQSISKGREEAFKNFPIKKVTNLKLQEIGRIGAINWRNPKLNEDGNYWEKHCLEYDAGFRMLYLNLKKVLSKGDVVITHNPWGEYGHEEHILVFNVVEKLSKEVGFKVFVTGYVSNRSIYLMHKTKQAILRKPLTYKIDKNLINLLVPHYKQYEIWTWWDNYKWPNYESFFALSERYDVEETIHSASEGLNHILFNEHNISFKDIMKFFLKNNVIKLKQWFNDKM